MSNEATANNVLVEALGSSLRSGGHALADAPELLKKLLAEQAWRDFVTRRGEHVTHGRFADFATTPPLKGLGSDLELIRRIVADDPEALDLLDQALKNSHGGDRRSTDFNVDNVHNERPSGNAESAALRSLRKRRPDLHADVLAERITAHAAMVKAGFRPKTVSMPVTRPEAVARSLLKHMSADDIALLIKTLLSAAG
jgi:hypothetical protein